MKSKTNDLSMIEVSKPFFFHTVYFIIKLNIFRQMYNISKRNIHQIH